MSSDFESFSESLVGEAGVQSRLRVHDEESAVIWILLYWTGYYSHYTIQALKPKTLAVDHQFVDILAGDGLGTLGYNINGIGGTHAKLWGLGHHSFGGSPVGDVLYEFAPRPLALIRYLADTAEDLDYHEGGGGDEWTLFACSRDWDVYYIHDYYLRYNPTTWAVVRAWLAYDLDIDMVFDCGGDYSILQAREYGGTPDLYNVIVKRSPSSLLGYSVTDVTDVLGDETHLGGLGGGRQHVYAGEDVPYSDVDYFRELTPVDYNLVREHQIEEPEDEEYWRIASVGGI